MFLAVVVRLVILGAISVRGLYLTSKLNEYNAKKQELEELIEAENRRTAEIEEYAKYTQTNEYVEEVAREKLGLVRENEIIFRDGSE